MPLDVYKRQVPRSIVLFVANPSSTDKGEYYDADVVNIDNDKTYSEVFYMLENCQGEVESITDPRDKSPENAPVCATYMRIVAEGADKVLEYTVYLGENSTSNFDVRRNTKHTMNLVIKGEKMCIRDRSRTSGNARQAAGVLLLRGYGRRSYSGTVCPAQG